MGFGRYITINQTIGGAYGCTLSLTKESFMATLDPGRFSLFKERSFLLENPHACPFLRKDGQRIICTIYQSRPRFCREYICHTGKVLHDGEVLGVMKGRRDLQTEDPTLRELWNALKESYGGSGDPAWKQAVQKALTDAGYEVVLYA